MSIVVSAPGKTILMGEHAAVYGRPALVAAVDRRLAAELSETGSAGVRLELPEVGVSQSMSWQTIRDYARAARRRWQKYDARPEPETFRRLRGDDPAHLVKVALGEAVELFGDTDPPGIELRLTSEIPIGAGFGSSAAAAVAIVGAVSRWREEPPAAELERLALEVERRQHGAPSGIDTATVIRGGLVWAVRDASGRVSVAPVAAGSPELGRIRVFNSGTPAESTGAVVSAVRARRDADPQAFDRLLERMEASTRELRRRLESEGETLVEPIVRFEACLEEAGVVPPRVRRIVREVEARGGAAKISGAGALTGRGAGSLLVYHPEEGETASCLNELERLDVRLGAEGMRVEDEINAKEVRRRSGRTAERDVPRKEPV